MFLLVLELTALLASLALRCLALGSLLRSLLRGLTLFCHGIFAN